VDSDPPLDRVSRLVAKLSSAFFRLASVETCAVLACSRLAIAASRGARDALARSATNAAISIPDPIPSAPEIEAIVAVPTVLQG
jgi:hypothetical protein